jgi:AcrR family transcriptional regulator
MTQAPATTPRQAELLDHALALAREVGLAGLTVRRLAERVGFTEAALYRHFPNKQALLLRMVERLSSERLLGPLRVIAADTARPAAERLEAAVAHHVRTVLAVNGLPVLILAEAAAAGDEALLERFRAITGEVAGLFERLLREAGTPAGAPDPRAQAIALFGLAAAAALHHRLVGDAAVEAVLREEMPRHLVRRLLGEAGKEGGP